MKRWVAWVMGALVLGPGAVLAVSTKSFVIDTSDAFEKGTFQGTAAHASGKLTRALRLVRTPIDGVPVAYASTVGKDGAIYVATGNEGAVYRVDQRGAKLFADTPAALVTSLVWVDGTLYAGTLPGGRIYAIASDGKTRELVKLEGAEHVWALAYDKKQRTLFAATGPEGKLFAVDLQGRAHVAYDDEAEHLLALAIDDEGRVYAGTSQSARLLRIVGREAHVLYDFPGQELGTIVLGASFVAVAANEFPAPPPAVGDTKDLGAAARSKRLKPGKGAVFTLDATGRVEELAQFDEAHVSALAIDPRDGSIHAGLAQEGRVVRLTRDGTRSLWADVDERQIAAIQLGTNAPHILSSDGVAVHRVDAEKRDGTWISAVLDAKTPARFGELALRARGTVALATRSGNTETPDASWSAWSSEASSEASGSAPIKSPPARFLQVRARLVDDAELYALEAYYLPQNLPARVHNVRLKPAKDDAKDKGPSSLLTLTWDVDNPDSDKLRYRLFALRDGFTQWLPLQREHELLEQSEFAWETRTVPDGHYRVRVVVSDEAANAEPYVARTETVSAPLLVDNHAPELLELRVDKGTLHGRALDTLGPIASLELAIDGGLFRPILPSDDLLDTRDERFAIALTLAPGPHTLAVRAKDAADNPSTAALEVVVPTR